MSSWAIGQKASKGVKLFTPHNQKLTLQNKTRMEGVYNFLFETFIVLVVVAIIAVLTVLLRFIILSLWDLILRLCGKRKEVAPLKPLQKVYRYAKLCLLILIAAYAAYYLTDRPEAKKLCFYSGYHADNITIEELKAFPSVCIEDPEALQAFHSAKRPLGLELIKGTFAATFIDKRGKEHLINIGYNAGFIGDATEHKGYIIKDSIMQRKFYDAINVAKARLP